MSSETAIYVAVLASLLVVCAGFLVVALAALARLQQDNAQLHSELEQSRAPNDSPQP